MRKNGSSVRSVERKDHRRDGSVAAVRKIKENSAQRWKTPSERNSCVPVRQVWMETGRSEESTEILPGMRDPFDANDIVG